MNELIDLNKYSEFVGAITSPTSRDLDNLVTALDTIDSTGYKNDPLMPRVNVATLVTAAMGMSGEAGEFSEIVKKVVFHGKTLTYEVKDHMIKELGDVMWYWTNACRAIGVDPNEVIALNVTKLSARYPGGEFSVFASANRAKGDV